jgi:hypothetical protein
LVKVDGLLNFSALSRDSQLPEILASASIACSIVKEQALLGANSL